MAITRVSDIPRVPREEVFADQKAMKRQEEEGMYREMRIQNREPIIPPVYDPKNLHRLTMMVDVIVDQCCDKPTSIEHRFCNDIKSEETSYVRKYKVKEEWAPLDLGYLKDQPILYLVIRNVVDIREEEDAYFGKLENNVLVAIDKGEPWIIAPNGLFVGCPSEGRLVYIRSVGGTATVALAVIPK